MRNLGPKSQALLKTVGVHNLDQLKTCDPYALYHQLNQQNAGVSLNLLYAMIGAQEDRHWLEIKAQRRLEILMRLEAMGLKPP